VSFVTFLIRHHLEPLDWLNEFQCGLVIDDRHRALRLSNVLLIRLPFLSFWPWARYTHAKPRIHGLGFFVAGLGTVGVAMLFEG